MIRYLIDFALRNRILVLSVAVVTGCNSPACRPP
jgi:hypothetical protein